jgi:group I intron endonuclease
MNIARVAYLYCLNFPNGKLYIGISNNPVRRLVEHIGAAKRQEPHLVYAAIRKYGTPQLQILCAGHKDYILALEITAIECFQTRDNTIGYNIARGGNAGTPGPQSTEHRAKIGVARLGKSHSEETRAKMSAALLGRAHSAQHRANIGAAQIGKTLSAEHRANISAARLGKPRKPFSEEHRAKLSAAVTKHHLKAKNAKKDDSKR